jgi:predicted DNA-binding transcriptional regulator YafY
MARGDQLARQWKIIETLLASHTGKTVSELADDLECNPRTVYRDLEALQAAGFPLYTERVDGKNLWSLLDTLKHHIPIPLTLTELLAIYFSQDMLKFLHNTVFHDSLESLFEKIKTTIPLESKQYLDTVRQTFQVTLKQFKEYGKYREVLNTIKDAALNHKTVEMVYFTMGRKKKTQRKVDPYRILFVNGTFYVIGYCHLRKDCRTFALERIKMLTTTDESFSVPDDFRLEDYMGAGFGVIGGRPEKIKIWFSPDIAGYIKEKTWHESQVINLQRDGSIIFEAEVAITEELVSWIMSWGSKAEVLEPQMLQNQIHTEAIALSKAYDEILQKNKQSS